MTETKKLVSPPTLEQFEAITDLRPYLLQTRTDWTIDCLHYLGDDAQKWWAERQNKKDQIVESVIEKYNQRCFNPSSINKDSQRVPLDLVLRT